MNQTDLQGETERALRADILGAVARGWCSPENAAKVMDADLANAICAELLPLFNAGVEQARELEIAHANRRVEAEADLWKARLSGMQDGEAQLSSMLDNAERRACELEEKVLQAVAGAYAAAAKHWPMIGYCFSLYTLECSCGWRGKGSWKHVDKEQFHKEWTEHILALTPADARQALDQQLEWHGRKVGAEAIRFVEKGTGRQHSTLADALAAAIASAKAQARLEGENEHFGEVELLKAQVELLDKLAKHWENDRDLWKQEHIMYRGAWLREIGGVIVRKTHEIDGFVLRTREVYEAAEKWWAHEKELEAAARTPDSGGKVDAGTT